jgi:transcriptional regulator with XRE-family HTH domain
MSYAVSMTASDETAAPLSPNELVIRRLKDGRARHGGISTYQLAERVAELTGSTSLSASVLQNLESGRRQQAVTVNEMLLLSFALGVPPEFFLAPPPDSAVRLTPTATVDAEAFLAWVQGRAPIEGIDPDQYAAVAADVLGDSRLSGDAALKAAFLRDAAGILDDYLADSDQVIANTRGQIRDLLTDLRAAIEGDADRTAVLSMIDGYLGRMPAS